MKRTVFGLLVIGIMLALTFCAPPKSEDYKEGRFVVTSRDGGDPFVMVVCDTYTNKEYMIVGGNFGIAICPMEKEK